MIIVDTSVWIDLLRDSSCRGRFEAATEGQDITLTRFTQLELLQGCRDEREWQLLTSYLEAQEYVEAGPDTWPEAARTFYLLRRRGITIRSPIDCCIAQLAVESSALLLHRDQDFERIATLGSLQQVFLRWEGEQASP